jgi:hypothetical protein
VLHWRDLFKCSCYQGMKAALQLGGEINLGRISHYFLPHLCHATGTMLLAWHEMPLYCGILLALDWYETRYRSL